NKLVAAQMVGLKTDSVAHARWYEFDTSTATPTVMQQGTITLGTGVNTSYPSIAINPSGDIGMTFLESSSTEFVSMDVTGRLAADPLGTMQTPFQVTAGKGTLNGDRGGDYSATEYDPVDNFFWSANEYAFDNSGTSGNWGTQMVHYKVDATVDTAPVIT